MKKRIYMKLLKTIALIALFSLTCNLAHGTNYATANTLKIVNTTALDLTVKAFYDYSTKTDDPVGVKSFPRELIIAAKSTLEILREGTSTNFPTSLEKLSLTATTEAGLIIGQEITNIDAYPSCIKASTNTNYAPTKLEISKYCY